MDSKNPHNNDKYDDFNERSMTYKDFKRASSAKPKGKPKSPRSEKYIDSFKDYLSGKK
jgi:hypothetical protein